MLYFISTLLLATVLLSAFFAGIIWFTKRSEATKPILFFLGFLAFDALWAFGVLAVINQPVGVYDIGTPTYAFMQLNFFSVCALIFFKWLFYKSVFSKERFRLTWPEYPLVALFFISIAAALVNNGLFGQIEVSGAGYADVERLGFNPVFNTFVLYFYGYAIYLLTSKLKKAKSVLIKLQLKWLLVSHTVISGFSILTNLVLANMLGMSQFSALGPIFTLLSLAIYAKLFSSYQLFDLRISLHRALTYISAFAIILSVFAALFLHIPADNAYLLLLATSLFLVVHILLFFPLRDFFSSTFTRLIFGSEGHFQDRLARLYHDISRHKLDLKEATRAILAELVMALNLNRCNFVAAGDLPLPVDGATRMQLLDHGTLYVDELESRAEAEGDRSAGELARFFRSQDIAVLQPVVHDDRVIGALTLSGKHDGTPFSVEELAAVEHVADDARLLFANQPDVGTAIGIGDDPSHRDRMRQQLIDRLSVVAAIAERLAGAKTLDSKKTKADLQKIHTSALDAGRALQRFAYLDTFPRYASMKQEATQIAPLLSGIVGQQLPWELAAHYGYKKKIDITVRGALAPETLVVGYPQFVCDALTELLINAVLHGSAAVVVELSEDDTDVHVTITNAGKLTQGELAACEQPLVALPKKEHRGYGLGISFAKTSLLHVGGSLSLARRGGMFVAAVTLKKHS